MSASSLRYVPAPDRNVASRARIVSLTHRHRRYGVGMIDLKLRQAGECVNHKRVDRLYAEERLQVRRRRRKKVLVADRQPLVPWIDEGRLGARCLLNATATRSVQGF